MINENNPTLRDSINSCIDYRLAFLRTATPARIHKYDSTTQSADVEVVLMDQFQGEDSPVKYPIIQEIPVVFPRSKKGILHFPLDTGDIGVLICTDRSIDDFVVSDGKENIFPSEARQFELSDSYFIPGGYPFKSAFQGNFQKNTVDIRVEEGSNASMGDGQNSIEIKPNQVSMKAKQGGKIYIGDGQNELFNILDQLLTLLAGNVDQASTNSTGTLSLIIPQLQQLQTQIQSLKVT